MVFVAAVCLIIRRHRRGPARREATGMETGHMNPHSEHENAPANMRPGEAERHNAAPRAILSEEVLVREPPPAYIPGGTASWQDNAEGFRVSTNRPFKLFRTETILQFETGGWTVGQRRSEGSIKPRYRHTCRYFDIPRRSRGRVVHADRRRGAAPLRGLKFMI